MQHTSDLGHYLLDSCATLWAGNDDNLGMLKFLSCPHHMGEHGHLRHWVEHLVALEKPLTSGKEQAELTKDDEKLSSNVECNQYSTNGGRQ